MAEERLIDDDLDKNKKYRIRKNADGEDELVIDETAEDISAGYEVVEPAFDDEDAAVLTPEQLAEREAERKRAREAARMNAAQSLESARAKLAAGDREGALEDLAAAEQYDPQNGDVYVLKVRALSADFTDMSRLDECVETAQFFKNFGNNEQRESLRLISSPLVEYTERREEEAAVLHVEVEKGKAQRRELFSADRKKWVLAFGLTVVPMIVCLIVALSFGAVIFTRRDNLNLIICIVFAALAAVLFLASLFTSHKMWAAMKRCSLNEKNSSTKLGREYEQVKAEVEKLHTLHDFFA